jgi:hypothetical protein
MITLDGVSMTEIVKICKIHGELNTQQTILNRLSNTGTPYLRCRECRNNSERNRIKIKYLKTPKKHDKRKVPTFIKHEDKSHAYTILHRFKLLPETYYSMLEKQNNLCAICKNPETQLKKKTNKVKMLSVDHCHSTGKIRGLLCHTCNTGLGSFKDSETIMHSAIDYLKASNQ